MLQILSLLETNSKTNERQGETNFFIDGWKQGSSCIGSNKQERKRKRRKVYIRTYICLLLVSYWFLALPLKLEYICPCSAATPIKEWMWEWLGEDISRLIFGANTGSVHETVLNKITCIVIVHLNMFCELMKHRILCYVHACSIITSELHTRRNSNVQIRK